MRNRPLEITFNAGHLKRISRGAEWGIMYQEIIRKFLTCSRVLELVSKRRVQVQGSREGGDSWHRGAKRTHDQNGSNLGTGGTQVVGTGSGLPFAVRVSCSSLLYRSCGGRGCSVLAVRRLCQGCLGVCLFGEGVLFSTVARGTGRWIWGCAPHPCPSR